MPAILIFDDRIHRRRYLRTVLTRHGYTAVEAGSVERALEIVRHAPPDLVLVDVVMPAPGSYHFVHRLRLESGPAQLRLVFLFAPYLENEARLLAQACGVAHLVADSDDTDALLQVIHSAMADAPQPQTCAQLTESGSALLSPVVSRLYGRVTELESVSTRLKRKVAASAEQLAVTRGALDREVVKRLWSEEDMTLENRRLREQSIRDPLTGLYNRRYLEETLAREESRARRSGKPFCVMMMDIDHFKQCNDTFGHAAGDQVLYQVSRCMESMSRPEDILCRFGGEEFVLVLTNIVATTLAERADNLRASIPRLNIVHEQQTIGPITLSIGLAVFPENGSTAEEVLHAADAALYQAKQGGRDRVVIGAWSAPFAAGHAAALQNPLQNPAEPTLGT